MPGRFSAQTGEFLPDIQDRDNPGIVRADNVLPHISGYTPAKSLVPGVPDLPSRCLGAAVLQEFDGTLHNYAGTQTALYELVADAYGDVGQVYSLPEKNFWEFVGFFDNAIAANGVNPLQVQTAYAGNFADIPGAPAAQFIAEVDGFLVTGRQLAARTKIAWSALRDHTIWAPGTQQAGEQILSTGGAITGVVGGEYGIVFCEHAIYRMDYIGDPEIVFQIREVVAERGTIAPGSLAQYGDLVFYIDSDGFYVFNGNVSRGLGSNKLNHTFMDDFDTEFAHNVRSAVDIRDGHVYWAYPSVDARGGLPDKIMVYDIHTQRFSGPLFVKTEELLYASLNTSVLLDDFVATNPLLSNWDVLPNQPPWNNDIELDMDNGIAVNTDVDSIQFKGGDALPFFAAFNSDHQLSTFTGPNMRASIESAEVSLQLGGRALVTGFRALVDGISPNVTVRIGYRDSVSGMVSWSAELTPNSITELADALIDARYHRFEINVDGDYEFIFGGEPEFEKAGFA